jgi:PadR family transcriptional regulator, regulatory protein AphA
MAELTPTSYALLGQLALRPWSVYDMTQNVRRTLQFFWPRAQSVLYDEVKRLERLELVASHQEDGLRGRPRTVYSITGAGRERLGSWLAEAPQGVALHHEPLLRVHLAPYGTRDDLLRALQTARDDAEALLRTAVTVGTEFVEERHQFQSQAHIRAILFDYLWNLGLASYLWAERSIEQVEAWEDLEATKSNHAHALDLMRRAVATSPLP